MSEQDPESPPLTEDSRELLANYYPKYGRPGYRKRLLAIEAAAAARALAAAADRERELVAALRLVAEEANSEDENGDCLFCGGGWDPADHQDDESGCVLAVIRRALAAPDTAGQREAK